MFFFFNDTATTEIYTLSLHDALPICLRRRQPHGDAERCVAPVAREYLRAGGPGRSVLIVDAIEAFTQLGDRKSTRLNSSHANISYAVFCLKKKTKQHSLNYSRANHLI